jgi:hypothetical protein
MDHIVLYLEKFSNINPSRMAIKKAVYNAVFDVIGVKLEDGEIEIKDSRVVIKTSPILRAEMFMRQKELGETVSKFAPGTKISQF